MMVRVGIGMGRWGDGRDGLGRKEKKGGGVEGVHMICMN